MIKNPALCFFPIFFLLSSPIIGDQDKHLEQFLFIKEKLTKKHHACEPEKRADSDILLTWSLINEGFSTLLSIDVPRERTDNCLTSKVLFPAFPLPDSFKYFGGAVVGGKHDYSQQPQKVCGHDDWEKGGSCCMENPHLDCINKWNLKADDGYAKKATTSLVALQAIGSELSPFAQTIYWKDLATQSLAGDTLYLAFPGWYLPKADRASLLLVELNHESINKLAAIIGKLMPTLRIAKRHSKPFEQDFICDLSGTRQGKVPDNLPPDYHELVISTGVDAELRKPVGVTSPYPFSVGLQANKFRTWISPIHLNNPPVGGKNDDLVQFSNKVIDGEILPFSCHGDAFSRLLGNRPATRMLNSMESSTFLFNILYLCSTWDVFFPSFNATEDSKAVVANLERDLEKGRADTSRVPPASCWANCQNSDPNCLLVEFRGADRSGDLKRLYQEVSQPLPFEITPERLAEIFGHQGDESFELRGTTKFDDQGEMRNRGFASYLKVPVADSFEVRLDVLTDLKGRLSSEGNRIDVSFPVAADSARISFSNEILDDWYGGYVRLVQSDNKRMIFTTTNGCLEVPYQPTEDIKYFKRQYDALGAIFETNSLKRIAESLRMFSSDSDSDKDYDFGSGNGTKECSCTSCSTQWGCITGQGCSTEKWTIDEDAGETCDPSGKVFCNCSN
ncbi:MAG: hypothetical protein JAY67_06925 [Candidatus Thiodiazotropha taylori]|nr:hypothetical protein [Candidatus Thiodiazotropha taylori]